VSLRLTNTLTRKIEEFHPLVANKASIYCCGVTVYDLCHLGHARSYIVWDILRRFLIWEGYEVTFVQNFTDIDDKILNRASEDGCTMNEISEKNIKEFHHDMDSLGILRPDRMPRATKCLHEICSLIKVIESKGAAYSIDGDVYFSVKKHSNYGKLSKRDLEAQQLNAGGRIEEHEEAKKKDSFDFALWKKAKKGEPSFSSPWGKGRPGWHIECSAMVRKELGETIDIHLGGADLMFPHHENEIAQSEIANGKELAKYWLHNGMVNVSGRKMSKSLGNFTTIRSLLKSGVSAMALRLFVLQVHYRKPLDFNNEALKAATKGWEGLNEALSIGFKNSDLLKWPKSYISKGKYIQSKDLNLIEKWPEYYQKFLNSLNEDLNTSGALSVLFELAKPLRSLSNEIKRGTLKSINQQKEMDLYFRWMLLLHLAGVLGIEPELEKENSLETKLSLTEINSYIKERQKAKAAKDFSKADAIREDLKSNHIELIDKPDGTTDWIKN